MANPDFSRYLDTPVESAERPEAPTIGHWAATISKWTAGERNYQPDVKTPVITLTFKLTSPYDDAAEQAIADGTDPSKFINKIVTKDYTLNEESGTYALRQVGETALELDVKGLSFGDMLPQLIGGDVKLYIEHRQGKGNTEGQTFPDVKKVLKAD